METGREWLASVSCQESRWIRKLDAMYDEGRKDELMVGDRGCRTDSYSLHARKRGASVAVGRI